MTPLASSARAVSDEYMTEREFALLVRQQIRTVQLWRLEGAGPPYIRPGKMYLYRRDDVQSWLDSLRVKPTKNEEIQVEAFA